MTRISLHRIISFEASRNRRVLPSAVAAAAILALMACARPEPQAASQEAAGSPGTVRVERRNLRNTARLHGTVAAVESYTVLAPRLSGQMTGTMVITGIAPNGSRVRKGDILVEFDRQNQMKTVLDRQAEYDNLVQQIRKKQADQEAARAADETELKTAEVDLQSARVEMRKNEVVSRIQAEINKQNLAEAEARLKQVNDTRALKREAAAAELRILEIQRDRAQKAVTYAQNNIEKMTVRSQLDGLVVLTPIYKGTRMVDPQEGDEVRPGGGIMLVVDPSAMQVVARLNQVDVAQVRTGMNTEVRLDAYPDLVFPGIVDRISAIGTSSQYSKRIRYFAAVISIRGSHPKLLPDLTAAVDVELEGSEDVLLLPREAVAAQNGQSVVRILTDGRTELRPVKTGPMNELEVVIESGLEEGMTVSRNPNSDAGAAVRQPD